MDLRNLAVGIQFNDDATAAISKINNEMDEAVDGVRKLGKGADKAEKDVTDLGRKGNKAASGMSSAFKKAAGAIAAAFATVSVVNLGADMVRAAGDAQAMNAQFEQVFGDMQGDAQKSINEMGQEFGMLPNRIKPAMSTMTSMFKGLGLDTNEAMEQAASATTLVADAAAFYDKSFEDANSALNSFVKGNYEGGESIGLFANETQLAAWAAENLGEDWKSLDEAGKQVARLQFAQSMQEAAGATGQAARESDGLENVLGNLRQAWTDFKAVAGQPLLELAIPAMQRLTTLLQDLGAKVGPAIDRMKEFGSMVKEVFMSLKLDTGEVPDLLEMMGLSPEMAAAVGGVLDKVRNAIYTVKEVFMSLKLDTGEVPDLLEMLGLSPEAAAAVGDILNTVRDKFLEVKAFISGLGETVAQYMPAIRDGISAAFTAVAPIISSLMSIWSSLSSLIMSFVNSVVIPLIPVAQTFIMSAFQAIQPVIRVVQSIFQTLTGVIRTLVENVITPLFPVAASIIQTAMNLINPILRIAGSLIEVLWGAIKFLVEKVVVPLFPQISSIITNVWSNIQPSLDAMASVFNVIADGIQWAIQKFKDFKSAVSNFKMPSFGLPKWMGGNGLIQNGSHATGLARVPFDGYTAELHRDESVLTADQSNALRKIGMLGTRQDKPVLTLPQRTETPFKGAASTVNRTTNHTETRTENRHSNTFYIQSSDPKGVRKEVESIFRQLNAGLA